MRCSEVYRCVLLIFLVMSIGFGLQAQNKNRYAKPKPSKSKTRILNDPFSNSQWWLGAKFGGNVTQAKPSDRFTAFSNIANQPATIYEKEYQDFNKIGAQAGLVVSYYYKGFTFSFQPNFRRQRFVYTNEYLWLDGTNPVNTLRLEYEQDHKIEYIEFPLLVRYDVMQTELRPFVQLGFYYGTLVGANKSVKVKGSDLASGASGDFENAPVVVGARDLFVNTSIGAIGGLGASWNVGNARVALEANYRFGLNNVANQANRYTENRLAGIGDAMDNIKLRNIEVNISVVFPLKFIFGDDYRAVD